MNSLIAWVGGKRLLKKKIISIMPRHNRYVEVFGGAGWVLFGKSSDKKDWIIEGSKKYLEVYNDINSDLVNFWKFIRYHPKSFVHELEQNLVSKEMFDDMKKTVPKTDLGKAVQFYYRIALSFGSMSKDFAVKSSSSILPLRNIKRVLKASERLFDVVIENRDYARIIKLYDSDETLFYLDPPYFELESFYERDGVDLFGMHENLCSLLKNIKGKFILSYNDHRTIREYYKDFTIEEVTTTYSLSGQKKEKVELLIRNY